MSLDLQNSDKLTDVPNLTVMSIGLKNYIPSDDYITIPQRLPMGSRLDEDYPYGADGYSNAKGSSDEVSACGKKPLLKKSKKGKAWAKCAADFHAGYTTTPSEIKSHCGKRPFFVGKRRTKYNKCKADLIASDKAKLDAAKAAQAQQQAQPTSAPSVSSTPALMPQQTSAPSSRVAPSSASSQKSAPPTPPKKSNIGLWIGIGALALGATIFAFIKLRKGAVATK